MSRGLSVRTSPNASTTTIHLHSSLTATEHSACRPALLEDSSAYRLRATRVALPGSGDQAGDVGNGGIMDRAFDLHPESQGMNMSNHEQGKEKQSAWHVFNHEQGE